MQVSHSRLEHFETVEVAGCRMRYRRSGTGAPVVLLHTLRTQLEYFDPLVRALGAGVQAIVPDLPGHGRSTAPRIEYTVDYLVDATEAFLAACGIQGAELVGESIGGAIALGVAARRNPRVRRVVALNPYDYGRWGGIRRSSPLANVLFTAMLWPGIGSLVARAGTREILRRVMAGGFADPRKLSSELVETLYVCGSLPGHARAFRSLCLNWRSWLAGRNRYGDVRCPVTLVYAEHDWSLPHERSANSRAVPAASTRGVEGCGHFSCLEDPERIAAILLEGGR